MTCSTTPPQALTKDKQKRLDERREREQVEPLVSGQQGSDEVQPAEIDASFLLEQQPKQSGNKPRQQETEGCLKTTQEL